MRYCSILLLLIWVATLHADQDNGDDTDDSVRLVATSAEISSINDDGNRNKVLDVLQDDDFNTYIQSKDGDTEHTWQYLDLTYDDTHEFATVVLAFRRWYDEPDNPDDPADWCEEYNEDCISSWTRLGGLAVGISDGTDHVSLCDVVAEYTVPYWWFTDPGGVAPIYAIVRCKNRQSDENFIRGSTIHIAQTKQGSVLQLSEVYVYSIPPENIGRITKLGPEIVYDTANKIEGSEPTYTEWNQQWEAKENGEDTDDEHECAEGTDCWSGAVRMVSSATVVGILLAKHFLA